MAICIIPARKGSKRIKNKNIKKINKIPLISMVIKLALRSKLFDKVIVSTDSKSISKIAVMSGAEAPYLRNKKLSNNYTPTYEVLIDVVKKLKIKNKFIFCIYPTSIMTKTQDLRKAFKLIKIKKADFLCPVIKNENNLLRSYIKTGQFIKYLLPKYRLYRSQDLPEIFSDVGSFYIYRLKALKKLSKKNPIPIKSIKYVLKNKFIDINYPKDLKLVRKIFKNKTN